MGRKSPLQTNSPNFFSYFVKPIFSYMNVNVRSVLPNNLITLRSMLNIVTPSGIISSVLFSLCVKDMPARDKMEDRHPCIEEHRDALR
jgi:hypothetical protein